jgi:4-hydroxy-tetrahydrodipicolinate synthase
MIASATVRRPGPALSASDIADIARLTRRQERRLAELGRPS